MMMTVIISKDDDDNDGGDNKDDNDDNDCDDNDDYDAKATASYFNIPIAKICCEVTFVHFQFLVHDSKQKYDQLTRMNDDTHVNRVLIFLLQ